jgi:hypothetical protein
VFGLTNFRGLICFFENVPKPLISTLLSKATASTIELQIMLIDLDNSDLLKLGSSFLINVSISDLVKVFFLSYSLSFNEILSLSESTAITIHVKF